MVRRRRKENRMTVYELIQRLAEFEPMTQVKVCVVGEQKHFDEYKAEAEGCEKMVVDAKPIYVEYPYYDAEYVEITCELEKL